MDCSIKFMSHSRFETDAFEKEVSSYLWANEIQRYQKIKGFLREWCHLFTNKNVLDFGAGYGLSMSALLFNGASSVIGIEPDKDRIAIGESMLKNAGLAGRARLIHVNETAMLPFEDEQFAFVLANAVLEHIPEPRKNYLCEMWRLVSPGGHLMIIETPNKYFPKEIHTTNLWFNHWLPKSLAYKRAIRLKRFALERKDWNSSGWRGLGYFEVVAAISKQMLVPECSQLHHRIFHALGIPASIIDPYPTWIFQKI